MFIAHNCNKWLPKAITRDITSNTKDVLSINSTFSGNNDFQSKLDAANIPLGQISRIKVSLANYLFGSVIKYRIDSFTNRIP